MNSITQLGLSYNLGCQAGKRSGVMDILGGASQEEEVQLRMNHLPFIYSRVILNNDVFVGLPSQNTARQSAADGSGRGRGARSFHLRAAKSNIFITAPAATLPTLLSIPHTDMQFGII